MQLPPWGIQLLVWNETWTGLIGSQQAHFTHTYQVPTQDSRQFLRIRVSAAQTKRTKQTQHASHGFPFYTVFSRQQQVPRTSENSKRTLTCKAELGAILRQGARPQCMWLKNKTVKVCLAYGESTGRQSTLLYATDGNYLEKEQRKWEKALK